MGLWPFGKKAPAAPAVPRLMCAVWDASEFSDLADKELTRTDVPGMLTFLCVANSVGIGSASASDLERLGLDAEAAWREGLASTRALLAEIRSEPLHDGPVILALVAERSIAMHAVLLFWGDRPEWTGAWGSVVMPMEKQLLLVGKCEQVGDLGPAVKGLLAVFQGQGGSLDDPPLMLWRDRDGFEPLRMQGGKVVPGPRLGAAIRAERKS